MYTGGLIAHLDELTGEIEIEDEHLKRNIDLNVKPVLSLADALSIVNEDVKPKSSYAMPQRIELVIFENPQRSYALAYHVHSELDNPLELRNIDHMVDARTGKILTSFDTLKSTAAIGTGAGYYSGQVSLNSNYIDPAEIYSLNDTTRGSSPGNQTVNCNHGYACSDLYLDDDNYWGDGQPYSGLSSSDPNGQTAAADAHYGIQKTWSYYGSSIIGRNGIDGIGTNVCAEVHRGPINANPGAYWVGGCAAFYDSTKATWATLDIMAHELTHGVSETEVNFNYSNGEAAALDESTSDIFGAAVEFWSNNGRDPGDWKIGERLRRGWLRDMQKPDRDTRSLNFWCSTAGNRDEHYASGIGNHFFYYLVDGVAACSNCGSPSPSCTGNTSPYLPCGMTGIGINVAAKIWYKAIKSYFQSNDDYHDARLRTLSAAVALYGQGSVRWNRVNEAWQAVNVTPSSSGPSCSD